MRWAFLLIHDRPEYVERTRESAEKALVRPDAQYEVDDTTHELGFSGAIKRGWEMILAGDPVDYVFHCEGDFLFNDEVPVYRMMAVLERNPYLAQMSLMRQPWSSEEVAAGSVMARHGLDNFVQRMQHGDVWVEQRVFFTTNPCVYPVGLLFQGWPQEEHSEGRFTHRLLQGPEARFGIWGAVGDAPRVTHIGDVRKGHGY